MLEPTEDEIQALIDKHDTAKQRNGSCGREEQPIYELSDILKYGMTYLYAREHMREGKVIACNEPFSIYRKHTCGQQKPSQEFEGRKSKFLEVSGMKKLKESCRTLTHCWTGHNLAILASDFSLQGYFKEELLFQRQFPDSCSMAATSEKIYLGLYSGDIVHFDPISQNEMIKHCHTDQVTGLSFEGNHLLSSSMDGSIFYKTKIPISVSGVLHAKLIGEEQFVCACGDNSIAVYDHGSIRPFLGHRERVKSLTYNRVGVSTSLDGFAGLLYNETKFEMVDIGCSFHKRMHPHLLVGYGLSDIVMYDLNQKQATKRIGESTPYVDANDNTLIYTVGSKLRIRDIRSAETIEVPLGCRGGEVSFSHTGDMALVCTDESPYVIDLKYI